MNSFRFKHKYLLHGKRKIKPKLSEGRYYLSSGVVGNYALFAGGYKSGGYSDMVEAFDKDLTRIAAPSLRQARYQMASAYIADYINKCVLFGGGRKGSSVYNYVEAYNESLTKSNCTGLPRSVYNLTGTRCSIDGIFAGGENSEGYSGDVYVYNASLTYSTPMPLDVHVSELASTALFDDENKNTLAVIGGGANGDGATRKVYIYNESSGSYTRIVTDLSVARHKLAATSIGGYALFGGGRGDGTIYPNVNAFDTSGTLTFATALSKSRMNLTATTANGKAYFAGGEVNSTKQDVVDCYDTSLIRTIEKPLSVARYALASATVGGKAIFAGGYGTNPSYSDAIDIYS